MDSRVQIELDRETHKCGSEVVGVIDLRIREPLCISKIGLSFSKITKLRLQKTQDAKESQGDVDDIEKDQEGYKYEFEVYRNADPLEEISSGHHRFPFKVRLRNGDGASSEIKGVYFDFLCDIKNRYELCAEVHTFGAQEPMCVVKREVLIVDQMSDPRMFHATVKILSPICFFSKKYDINFELDKSLYYSGECLLLRALVLSEKQVIKQVECFVYEILSVSVDGQEVVRTKYVVGGKAKWDGEKFETSLRIPSTTPSTVTEDFFSLKAVLFVNVSFHRGSPVKIKRYLSIVKRSLIMCPELDCVNILEGEVYPEKIFTLS